MYRRDFIKNLGITAVTLPFIGDLFKHKNPKYEDLDLAEQLFRKLCLKNKSSFMDGLSYKIVRFHNTCGNTTMICPEGVRSIGRFIKIKNYDVDNVYEELKSFIKNYHSLNSNSFITVEFMNDVHQMTMLINDKGFYKYSNEELVGINFSKELTVNV